MKNKIVALIQVFNTDSTITLFPVRARLVTIASKPNDAYAVHKETKVRNGKRVEAAGYIVSHIATGLAVGRHVANSPQEAVEVAGAYLSGVNADSYANGLIRGTYQRENIAEAYRMQILSE